MPKKDDRQQQEVIGWYQPHIAVDWTGEILDPKTGELIKEASMTKQSFKDECDINNIVKRFEASGIIDHLNLKAREGAYIDLPDPVDYQEALAIAQRAGEAFASLPAELRARFQNDPERFLDYVQDPANQEEMINLGLAVDTRPKETPPTKVEVVNPPAKPADA